MPTITFNTIGELVTYIDQFIKVNHNNEITGEQHNNVENGLAQFIISSPINYNKAYVTATAAAFVGVASQCVLVFKSGATGSVELVDNKWNEWVVYNNSGANKALAGSIATYKTFSGQTKNYFSNGVVTHLAKGSDNIWYQIDNGAGGGGSDTKYDPIVDTIATPGNTYTNSNLTGATSIDYVIVNKQIYTEVDGDYTIAGTTITFTDISLSALDTIIIPLNKPA